MKKPIIYYFSIFALGILIFGCAKSLRTENTPSKVLNTVAHNATIKAGYIVYPPTVTVKQDASKPSGFFIDIMDEIGKRAGFSVTYAPITFDEIKEAINSPRFDVIVGGVFITVPRAREMAFTSPVIYWSGVAALGPQKLALKNVSDLNNNDTRIAVTAGTAEHEFVKQHFPKANINAIPNGDLSLTLAEVSAGRADVAFADYISIKQFTAKNPALAILFGGKPLNIMGVGFVVKKDDREWQDFMSTAITALHTDGTIRELGSKYPEGEKMWMLPEEPWEHK